MMILVSPPSLSSKSREGDKNRQCLKLYLFLRIMRLGWDVGQRIKRKTEPIARVFGHQVVVLKIKVRKTKRKVKNFRKRGASVARNAILPILPGVSKLMLLESPVPHLLRSNDPPGEEEVALAKTVIGRVEEEEERMKVKLFSRLLGRDVGYWSTVTRHKIQQTSHFIQQHRGVVSRLRILPPEILQDIFLSFAGTRMEAQWTIVTDLPWVLGQVCRTWRQNALALSSLWSHLPTMDLSTQTIPIREKSQLECIEELLRRSRSARLDVYLFALGFKGVSHPLVDLLIQHCERWEVATIKIDISLLDCFRQIKDRLPVLKSLSLYLSGYGSDLPTVDMFEGAPQLRQVDVGGPFLADLTLPFSQLTLYKDKMRMRNSITRVVTSSNSLETLTILELCETSNTPPIPAVTLPHMRKLQVKFCCTHPDFLSNLSLPVIEEIQMVSYHDRGGVFSSLISIVSNSPAPSPLKVLRFRSHAVQEGQLPDLLRITPHLNHLNMPLPYESDIDALTDQPIAPLLESCEFFIHDVTHLLHDNRRVSALNRFAQSRCETGVPDESSDRERLKSLELHFDRSRWIPRQKLTLEGWGDRFYRLGMIPRSEYLRSLKHNLHLELPELEWCRSGSFGKKRAGKVKDILNSIETFDWLEAGEIFVSFS